MSSFDQEKMTTNTPIKFKVTSKNSNFLSFVEKEKLLKKNPIKKFYIKEDVKNKLLNTFEWLIVGALLWVVLTISLQFYPDLSIIHLLEQYEGEDSLILHIYKQPFVLLYFFCCKEFCYTIVVAYTLWKIKNEWFGNPFDLNHCNTTTKFRNFFKYPNSKSLNKNKLKDSKKKKVNLTK